MTMEKKDGDKEEEGVLKALDACKIVTTTTLYYTTWPGATPPTSGMGGEAALEVWTCARLSHAWPLATHGLFKLR